MLMQIISFHTTRRPQSRLAGAREMKDKLGRRKFLKTIAVAAAIHEGMTSTATSRDKSSEQVTPIPTREFGKTGAKLPILSYIG